MTFCNLSETSAQLPRVTPNPATPNLVILIASPLNHYTTAARPNRSISGAYPGLSHLKNTHMQVPQLGAYILYYQLLL